MCFCSSNRDLCRPLNKQTRLTQWFDGWEAKILIFALFSFFLFSKNPGCNSEKKTHGNACDCSSVFFTTSGHLSIVYKLALNTHAIDPNVCHSSGAQFAHTQFCTADLLTSRQKKLTFTCRRLLCSSGWNQNLAPRSNFVDCRTDEQKVVGGGWRLLTRAHVFNLKSRVATSSGSFKSASKKSAWWLHWKSLHSEG